MRPATVGAVDGDVGHAGILPGQELAAPILGPALAGRYPHLEPDRARVPACLLDVAAQLRELGIGHRPRRVRQHDPAVARSGDAPERHVLMAAEPQGDAPPDGQGIDAGILDGVPLALEGHVRLGPQRLHDLDLLLLRACRGLEALVEADVLDGVPADPDAEAEAPAGQHVEGGRLLGDQRRLPLRQDHHLRGELDALGAGAEEPEQHERVVKEVLGSVARTPVGPARDIDAEHMVGRAQMVVAQALRGLREIPHGRRVPLDVHQRQRDAELHGCPPPRR